MISPPFKRSVSPLASASGLLGSAPVAEHACCEAHALPDQTPAMSQGRTKLGQLDPHLHCSVIGTCLSTSELRKLMARFAQAPGATDLDIHHAAVALASQRGEAAKALHKALDQRHGGAIKTFAMARDSTALAAAWDEANRQGEIPGAYWAVLTHRQVTPELRQRVFGEVHMLSHLVGAANRADIRRLQALERDNADLHARLERESQRRQELVLERDELGTELQQQSLSFERQLAGLRKSFGSVATPASDASDPALVALHTARRERAEQAASAAAEEVSRLQVELAHLQQHAQTLSQELSAVESELRQMSGADAAPDHQAREVGAQLLAGQLKQRRILYVGGRPSSTPAIRDLVLRHGGEFLHHDGGLEVRKGLLAAAVPNADLVVFPVDCIDHDSALTLKRLSERHGVPFVALRKASVASFAAGLIALALGPQVDPKEGPAGICLRHG